MVRDKALLRNMLDKSGDIIMRGNKAKNVNIVITMARLYNAVSVQKNKSEWSRNFVTMPKIIFIFILLLFISGGCIKLYEPDYQPEDRYRIVVDGLITSQAGIQTISLYYTSPINEPIDSPVVGCKLWLIGDGGKVYSFNEDADGKYIFYMNTGDLAVGSTFQLFIETPDKDTIRSTVETILPPVPVGNIYYETNTIPTKDPLNPREGIQFFIDLDAQGSPSEYFKWDLVETWEKHAPRPIIWWYDGILHKEDPPDYSRMLCWQTEPIPDIFTLTTKSLSTPMYKKFPLHFVDTRSQRLSYKYSLLINQLSISATTFDFWDKMKKNIEQKEGLYSKQPISVIGNLTNITHPEKVILGNFSVVGISQKRIFVSDVQGINADFEPCKSSALRFGLWDVSPFDYPAYLDGNDYTYFNAQLSPGCVDCTRNGGTTIKPVFWP